MDREPSPLLRLPAELRNRVYRYATVDRVMFATSEPCPRIGSLWKNSEPALALTCKQIRHEVLPIYYAESTFDYPTSQGEHPCASFISKWLDSIGSFSDKITQVGATIIMPPYLVEVESIRQANTPVMSATATIVDGLPETFDFFPDVVSNKCSCFKHQAVKIPGISSDTPKLARLTGAMATCYNVLLDIQQFPDCNWCQRRRDQG